MPEPAGAPGGSDAARGQDTGDGVVVVGVGRTAVRPDALLARLGAEVTAQSVAVALDRCGVAVAAVTAALKAVGVADTDLQTAGASVHAAYDAAGHPRGWSATEQLTARLRDLDRAGSQLSGALGVVGDAARLHDLRLTVADRETLAAAAAQARRQAWADAVATATQHAELAGRPLGGVRSVREVPPGHQPLGRGGPEGRALRSAALPVEAGEHEVEVDIEVRWAFR